MAGFEMLELASITVSDTKIGVLRRTNERLRINYVMELYFGH